MRLWQWKRQVNFWQRFSEWRGNWRAELKAEIKSELEAEEKTKAKREVDQKSKREAEEKAEREEEPQKQNQSQKPLSEIKERLAEVSQIASSSKMEEAVLLRQVQDMEGTTDVSWPF